MAVSERMDPIGSPSWSRKATILLVEDDVLVRYATADVLRGDGHEVVEAANLREAISLLHAGVTVELLISAIPTTETPNGVELVGLACSVHPDLPVLLTSSDLPVPASVEAAVLPKPFADQTLLETVQMLIRNG